MTFLKTENGIQPVTSPTGRRYYKVEFDLVIRVDGRNLYYDAFYPPGEEGRLQKAGQTCIAAAFIPGTK
jgi:hypothetical protein